MSQQKPSKSNSRRVRAAKRGTLKSIPNNVLSSIQLYNYTDQVKRSYFLDYNRQRSYSYDLSERGGSVIWFGWVNMAFLIADANGNCVEIYVIERRPGRGTTGARADFSAHDQRFAPSVERFNFSYTVRGPSTRPPAFAKFEVFKNGDSTNPIYRDESIPRTGINVQYQQSGTVGWDGKMNQGAESGNYIEPKHSPLTIRLSAGYQANYSDAAKDEKALKIEIHSIALTPSGATKVYKPTLTATEIDKPIEALVKLKKKDGSGVVTAIPLKLNWSFEDPDDTSNNNDIDANQSDGNDNALADRNGKRGDSTMGITVGIMWKSLSSTFPTTVATDGQTAESVTATSGTDAGKTKLNFAASVIGGDNYILVARYLKSDGTTLVEKRSGTWSIWKRLNFNNVYKMSGGQAVNVITTVANVDPSGDRVFSGDGYTEYTRGAVTNLPSSNQSPEFIVDLLPPQNSDLPAAGDSQQTIDAKAQKWYNDNENHIDAKLLAYYTLINAPANSLIGARYLHPKFDDRTSTGSAFDYYPAATRINSRYGRVDPDKEWGSEEGTTIAGRAFIFLNVVSQDKAIIVARHEIGHASDHVLFDVNDPPGIGDHASSGLMHPTAQNYSVGKFSPKSILRLRGVSR